MDIVFSRIATALGLGARLMLSLGSSGICQKQRMCCDGELDGGYVPTIPDSFCARTHAASVHTKDGDFSAISVKERSCTTPISLSEQSHIG